MNQKHFVATLSKGRKSWCGIFRHPILRDSEGKPGYRIRFGLGTTDEGEAQKLIDELNTILRDESFHSPASRAKAEANFNGRVVKAFYDGLLPDTADPWLLRDEVIPLPGRDEGYGRVRFIGPTAAGKTTILRQFIGTHPNTERFPSTSPNRTTTSEIEVVLRSGDFQAVVTFIPKNHARLYTEECVTRAAVAALEGESEQQISAALLEHTEQRFRLRYLLGTPSAKGDDTSSELVDDDDLALDSSDGSSEALLITPPEREQFASFLTTTLNEIRTLARVGGAELEKELGFSLPNAAAKERDAFLDLFELNLPKQPEFHAIVDRIMDAVEERFEMFNEGELVVGAADWPAYWKYTSADRSHFLRIVNRFSSNYAPHFGKLLTPLVSGMRVAGPFQPAFVKERPKLVLMDGEGLGHAADISSSVTTEITKRYSTAETIVLIDSAAQPMLSAPCAVLRSIASSGHDHKLAICFTHFDKVKGPNLPDIASRKQLLVGAIDNALSAIAEAVESDLDRSLKRHLRDRVFFLSNIHNVLPAGAKRTQDEFKRMLEMFAQDIIPPRPVAIQPSYDDANLVICLQNAVAQFRDPWKSRLGFPSRSSLPTEHWTRIKALSRRFAALGKTEYDSLRPAADLLERMQERMMTFLSKPVRWEPAHAPEDMQRDAVAAIQRILAEKLRHFVEARIRDEHLKAWIDTFNDGGTGSARRRANAIETIFNESAPVIGEAHDELSYELLKLVRRIVREAVETGGGKMLNSAPEE
jgi:hypothetical protein